MAKIKIHGYADQISVRPGDSITIMASAEGTDRVQAQLVRLIHGDENPAGPGFIEQTIDCSANGEHAVQRQYPQLGSFLRVADPDDHLQPGGSFSIHGWVWPAPARGLRQTLLGRWSVDQARGFAVGLNPQGHLELWLGDGARADAVACEVPMLAHCWYFFVATFDAASGLATIRQFSALNRYNSLLGHVAPIDYGSQVAEKLRVRPSHSSDVPFLIAGASDHNEARGRFVTQCFNGKIDRCGIHGRVLRDDEIDALRRGSTVPPEGLIARWDPTAGYGPRGIGHTVVDTGPHGLHAEGVNAPVRAMTGYNWNGHDDSFRLAPEQYGG
ncbi:MAG: LamG domain-containing protein, partial [Burkholderiales bacterium]|nr:LamG domain-containing protein [Burkholderiales bacterium]